MAIAKPPNPCVTLKSKLNWRFNWPTQLLLLNATHFFLFRIQLYHIHPLHLLYRFWLQKTIYNYHFLELLFNYHIPLSIVNFTLRFYQTILSFIAKIPLSSIKVIKSDSQLITYKSHALEYAFFCFCFLGNYHFFLELPLDYHIHSSTTNSTYTWWVDCPT